MGPLHTVQNQSALRRGKQSMCKNQPFWSDKPAYLYIPLGPVDLTALGHDIELKNWMAWHTLLPDDIRTEDQFSPV